MTASPLAPAWLSFPTDVNALREIQWAAGVSRDPAGELSVQGLGVSALAKEFGTPLFVMDEDDSPRAPGVLRPRSTQRLSSCAGASTCTTPARRFCAPPWPAP